MAITKHLTSLLKGSISLDSFAQEGSLFYISLEVDKAHKVIETEADTKPKPTEAILYADEIISGFKLFNQAIEPMQIPVYYAPSLAEVIKLLHNNIHINTVVVNLHEPERHEIETFFDTYKRKLAVYYAVLIPDKTKYKQTVVKPYRIHELQKIFTKKA